MSKAVLISIQPKWCELIASGDKTIEVRKTRPKLDVPFKCYIYCTKDKTGRLVLRRGNVFLGYREADVSGKVIGEFVCKATFPISITYSDPNSTIALREFPFTCLTDKEIMDYLGNGKKGYGWHISNLIIYDKPKELSEFYRHDTSYDNSFGGYFEDRDKRTPITRPPQSWCYVEKINSTGSNPCTVDKAVHK